MCGGAARSQARPLGANQSSREPCFLLAKCNIFSRYGLGFGSRKLWYLYARSRSRILCEPGKSSQVSQSTSPQSQAGTLSGKIQLIILPTLCLTNFPPKLPIFFHGYIRHINNSALTLREAITNSKKDFLWNHFIKWWAPRPRPSFYEVPNDLFFRPFLEQKKRWFWRLFEGCWWVF